MISVFYRPEQNAPPQGASPSAAKPQHVVESWLKKFPKAIDMSISTFTPATLTAMVRVHDPNYVNRVLMGAEENGFATKDVAVAKSLLYTSGSMLAAARCALEEGVACSPTSGFHHACYAHGGGFCTFNGLMVTAAALISERKRAGSNGVRRVAILDMDQHYGNGTDDIIRRLSYGQEVVNATRRPADGPWPKADVMIQDVIQQLEVWKKFDLADIVLYQAGADMHINDPYGGTYTSEELRLRDRTVFETCKRLKLPVAWNLAGGYQPDKAADPEDFAAVIRPVLDIHDATMEECIAVFGGES